ncbi:hypothetical protein [Wolbachia endosymbiont of Dipetalonema caudispina]|uniref:hypothetical protein n=1 Tax=Wolbachia endosymbiont of Dipetalonema caudispina TaxID=1812112 RepID=UPI00158DF46D|nr:hypothetical protein [Wolbachia endosymbiont of Dipetalonema caudispina]
MLLIVFVTIAGFTTVKDRGPIFVVELVLILKVQKSSLYFLFAYSIQFFLLIFILIFNVLFCFSGMLFCIIFTTSNSMLVVLENNE